MEEHCDSTECESFADKTGCEWNIDRKIQGDINALECLPIIIHESVLLIMACVKWQKSFMKYRKRFADISENAVYSFLPCKLPTVFFSLAAIFTLESIDTHIIHKLL